MDLREAAEMACILEATARKPGNVHAGRNVPGLRYGYLSLIQSAVAIGPILAQAADRGLGTTILDAAAATRARVGANPNLGVILLLAPLCAIDPGANFRRDLDNFLDRLGTGETRLVYEAIRIAKPAGLGKVKREDVESEPTLPLRAAMRLAADRDLVARQYASAFADVFDFGLPALLVALEQARCLEDAIIWCQLALMAQHPDSLIGRQRGAGEAEESARRARALLTSLRSPRATRQGGLARHPATLEFDAWLCEAGSGRNPGTTADLVTAILFWALRADNLDLKSLPFGPD